MTTADLLKRRTPPIPPELLEFGVGVFQAAILGASGSTPSECDRLACVGIDAVEREIFGHGLPADQESSLLFRVLAFPQLLEAASLDARLAAQVRRLGDGYEVSPRFIAAAAACPLKEDSSGLFQFDLQSLALKLLH